MTGAARQKADRRANGSCPRENELVGEPFTHWFLREQREEVASMSDLLSIVECASESNVLLVEDYLARNPVGDQGDVANAPPAAGGAL
ncbi:MAG TPA: hypothetical protein VF877_02840 [Gaiellaceae bacterium]